MRNFETCRERFNDVVEHLVSVDEESRHDDGFGIRQYSPCLPVDEVGEPLNALDDKVYTPPDRMKVVEGR